MPHPESKTRTEQPLRGRRSRDHAPLAVRAYSCFWISGAGVQSLSLIRFGWRLLSCSFVKFCARGGNPATSSLPGIVDVCSAQPQAGVPPKKASTVVPLVVAKEQRQMEMNFAGQVSVIDQANGADDEQGAMRDFG